MPPRGATSVLADRGGWATRFGSVHLWGLAGRVRVGPRRTGGSWTANTKGHARCYARPGLAIIQELGGHYEKALSVSHYRQSKSVRPTSAHRR
jgi:hypothetical protein